MERVNLSIHYDNYFVTDIHVISMDIKGTCINSVEWCSKEFIKEKAGNHTTKLIIFFTVIPLRKLTHSNQ